MPGAPGGRNQYKMTQKVMYFFLDYSTTASTTTTTRVVLLFKDLYWKNMKGQFYGHCGA